MKENKMILELNSDERQILRDVLTSEILMLHHDYEFLKIIPDGKISDKAAQVSKAKEKLEKVKSLFERIKSMDEN